MKIPTPSAEVLALRRNYICPDCNVDKRLRWDGSMYHLDVFHDDTCPALARMEGRLNLPEGDPDDR